jgi:anti-sigma-K factor RskA
VESYVLGLATEAEQQEFEAMCRQYPEVAQARDAFERQLEQQWLQNAMPTPLNLKEKIHAAVRNVPGTAIEIPEEKETPVRRLSGWKLMAAASVLLLIGALAWAITLQNKNSRLQAQNSELQNTVEATAGRLQQLEADAQRLQSPNVKMAAMQGTANAPGAFATVYWDTTSKDVYMLINNLPRPASNKQYQLWALLDGKPVDLGVFDVRQERLLVKMKNVQAAQAFAITLEPKGGSTAPTLDSLYVMGKL